jgi:tetratricopeptide (TPR) repeat protein
MRKLLVILLAFSCLTAQAQKADLRKGNRQFAKGQFAEADISYRRALLQDTTSAAAHYNLANTLYREDNMDEAAKQLEAVDALSVVETPLGPDYFFNKGDVALKKEDWKGAMEAFWQSLLLRPDDLDAKENYIYARNKYAQQQQQQQQQNQDQNQNQDQDQQDQQDQQNQQDQQQNQDQDQPQQQPQAKAGELSPQQAQQLLQAIQDKEKQTQEKVDAKKAEAVKSRQKDKNW